MIRNNCIICNNPINFLYRLNDMPISLSPTNQDIKDDIFKDQNFYNCVICGCVQLYNLIDVNILYKDAHNLTMALPMWNNHHNEFSNFILNNIVSNSILEIGGSSGALYNRLHKLDYSCMDICDSNFDTSNINYIKGNCEEYNFENIECIVLSHVFEHLYNPQKFIENISNHVTYVYISIPNMSSLLENKSSSILHYEHTYYIDKYFMEYLFSVYGYSLHKYKEFGTHSLFMLFKKTNCHKMELMYRDISNDFLTIYNDAKRRFPNKILENSFIVPGGHMGQLVYTLCKPTSILGFLDNDKSKHYKRNYGTPYYIYPFDKLKENTFVNVYIYAGPYLNELLIQLKEYNINIIII